MIRLLLNLLFYILLLLSLSLASCASSPKIDPIKAAFEAEKPRSILVVPPKNQTSDADAPDYFLSTITAPLIARGYYVFPVFVVQQMLIDDNMADAKLIHEVNPVTVASLFGADAVLYVTIERWDARYILLQREAHVALSYQLKSGKSGKTLWQARHVKSYQLGNKNDGVLTAIAKSPEERHIPHYLPLAREAQNDVIFSKDQGLPEKIGNP